MGAPRGQDHRNVPSVSSSRSERVCGIVGYTGMHEASPILLSGLRRLEYRGYDSAGLAILNGGLHVRKRAGQVRVLEAALAQEAVPGTCGISHTRWATHGPANTCNA